MIEMARAIRLRSEPACESLSELRQDKRGIHYLQSTIDNQPRPTETQEQKWANWNEGDGARTRNLWIDKPVESEWLW